jgi:O-antigen/teichoic acid export membrane protein
VTPPLSSQPSPSHSDASHSLGRRVLVNTGALSGSSLWRIGISFLLQLLIARILGVQPLGVYTVALAYLNVGQVLSELGLPALLSRDLAAAPEQRRAYYRLALRVQFVAALLVWASLVLLALLLPYGPATRSALILIGASLPFYAVTSVSETLFRAAERMELVMGVEVFVNMLILLLSVLLLLSGTTVLHLIGVLVVTQALSALTCVLILRRAQILAPPQASAAPTLRALWLRTSPFFSLSIAEVLQQRMDILLLSIVAGPTVTGIYSAAYNLVRVLVKLIQSVWQALYPTLSRLYHETSPKYQILCNLSLRFGLMVLLPGAALTTAVADDLIRLIYSQEYASSIPVLQGLIWITPLLFIEAYAVTLLMVRGRPLHSLAVIVTHLIALLVALPALVALSGATGAAWASAFAALVGAAAGLFVLRRLSIPISFQKLGWMAGATLVAGLLAALPPIHWLLSIAAGLAIYLLLIRLSGVLASDDMTLLRRTLRPNPE